MKLLEDIKNLILKLTKDFHYDEEVINILTLCYFAITSFDPDVRDILEYVLSRKYILINDGSYDKLLKNINPSIDLTTANYQEPSFGENRLNEDDFIVICDWRYSATKRIVYNTVRDLLDAFLHEIKHAMNSVINSYCLIDNIPTFLCGLCGIGNNGETDFLLLEETFNSFLVKLYLTQISKLQSYPIADKGLANILNDFSMKECGYSYHKCTTLLEPLFMNQELFILFYNASLYKDYEPLFTKLETLFNYDSYYIFDVLLNDYNNFDRRELPIIISETPILGQKLTLNFNHNNFGKIEI